MKLAAALMRRADLQAQINDLSVRLANNARVQEGEQPAESPEELLTALEAASAELEQLIVAINLTNAQTVHEGLTVTARIAHRDMLMQKSRILRDFLNEASNLAPRYSKTEIKMNSAVDVRQMQKKLDALAKELRTHEEALQALNWTIDLIEPEA